MASSVALPATDISLVSRLTEHSATPGTAATARSTRAEHAAQVIFDDCADDLAEMVNTGYRRSGVDRLVLNGGIFRHFPEYVDAVRQRIPERITLVLSDVPPLLGAAAEALYDAGCPFDESFRKRFLELDH